MILSTFSISITNATANEKEEEIPIMPIQSIMTITELYTGNDQQSHFREIEIMAETQQELGMYSQTFPTSGLMLRSFNSGITYDWHTAPQRQYIIYLEGEVEIEIGSGEKRRFKSGDILLANDLTGKGHITRTLTAGKSVILTTMPKDLKS
jgi:quercetin dioxygenase-like cupin family protein